MIDDAELISGLDFLWKHSDSCFRPILDAARIACREEIKQQLRKKMRAMPVEGLELSIRSHLALERMGIWTVGDMEKLVELPDAEIMERGKRHYFGKKCLKEVRLLLVDLLR